ncbi:MAG: DUF6515 family protein [Gammaproteobacteria bacterium]|nr:DUF6515 family protein [Gammaproteobacteria bacterium]MDD9895233.1 DUF6515 family protein [Gammaproteobacteria bacterium]MDD9958885.1 DUF6515 family protein [Gammaproteobacteria bacterium]
MKLFTVLSAASFIFFINMDSVYAGPHPGHQHKRLVIERNVVVHKPVPVRTTVSRVIGAVLHSIPANHVRVVHTGKVYYVHDGVYYAKRASGYVVVNPIAGIRLASLPRGYRTVVVNGERMYRYRDIHYRKINGRYVVV